MRRNKMPSVKMLVWAGWLIPLLGTGGMALLFSPARWILFPVLSLFGALLLFLLVRLFANIGQMVFEIQNILQYQYKEHKDFIAGVEERINKIAFLNEESAGRLNIISENAAKTAACAAKLAESASSLVEKIAGLAGAEKDILEEISRLKGGTEQIACDLRDISGFFSKIEQHLGVGENRG